MPKRHKRIKKGTQSNKKRASSHNCGMGKRSIFACLCPNYLLPLKSASNAYFGKSKKSNLERSGADKKGSYFDFAYTL